MHVVHSVGFRNLLVLGRHTLQRDENLSGNSYHVYIYSEVTIQTSILHVYGCTDMMIQ